MFRILCFVSINFVFFTSALGAEWSAVFYPERIYIEMDSQNSTQLILINIPDKFIVNKTLEMRLISQNSDIAEAFVKNSIVEVLEENFWSGNVTVKGIFLGKSEIRVELRQPGTNNVEISDEKLIAVVVKEKRLVDKIFQITVGITMIIVYMAFGILLDLNHVKGIIIKPVGPVIGFIGQFLFMPLIAYVLGLLLFPTKPWFALSLFFVGTSPAGAASNVLTVVFGGNLDLSITMTTISTFAMFGMIPLWIFTLGKVIFDKVEIKLPYVKIGIISLSLLIPLGIGIIIQRILKKSYIDFLAKYIKRFCLFWMLFFSIFGNWASLHLFRGFTWQIVVAGAGLPACGYIVAYIFAWLCRQSSADCLTIAIETGIQNAGIAMFLLQFIGEPLGNETILIPISVIILTKFMALTFYILQKIKNHVWKSDVPSTQDEVIQLKNANSNILSFLSNAKNYS